jgi:hypothetical protein
MLWPRWYLQISLVDVEVRPPENVGENRAKAVRWDATHAPTRYKRHFSFDHRASNLITPKSIRQEKERTEMRYM